MRTRSRFVDVFSAPSPARRPRVGVVVPRFGNSAAARNVVRRRLRELARREWLPAALDARIEMDVILRAKPSAYGVSYRLLRKSLEEPLSRVCVR
ncbi:MAG: ribonuclease P protein component [Gemmatimonadota bacterium]|nr:ribonuclease P protein component [Gemmatimonadota bacterium]